MTRLAPAALAATALLALSAATPAVAAPPAHAQDSPARGDRAAFTFGVIGDVPYGDAQVARFPAMVDELSAQDELRFLAHVGDVKAGSAVCSDEYFTMIRDELDTLSMPLVLTPGDNDWTDCHRANNGAYDPLERLATFREIFYPEVDRTLGATMPLDTQSELGLPENARFRVQRLEFAVLNVQGSENSTLPWTGLGLTEPTRAQLAEVAHRDAANAQLLRETFADATRTNARGVVVMLQADMFDPKLVVDGEVPAATAAEHEAFAPTVRLLADLARDFEGPVYLVNGDSHRFTDDAPLAAGSPWLDVYDEMPVDNLRRITVEGDATSNEWTRFSVAPNSAGKGHHAQEPLLRVERVPYRG